MNDNDLRLILLHEGRILLEKHDDVYSLPSDVPAPLATSVSDERGFSFGSYRIPVLLAAPEMPEPWVWMGLREAWQVLPEDDYRYAAKGGELLHWNARTRFCGRCGVTMRRASEISKSCPRCGEEIFPSTACAILVLVIRDDKALLVRAKSFKRRFFGLVAGFVETGESLEECVAREVKEETSLEISDIRYFGSQSWPFPFNQMIGFIARYAGGEIRFADDELAEGRFFSRDDLPALATPPSLARRMIDAWIAGEISY